ncbi:Uu.00g063970.m01.CDS01 [Anthostomella pinea]|uniref:Uu.00g063970.m01.CDS01 n=1 Tax=Anthostomella pinea TaxID=933095 RepID=A0AAI8YKM5_9PEZI|nr:Uu.00g063970.m01.CDS01 [Anthostomella pinea]
MRFSKTLAVAAGASTANAQRPADTPICDYYTTALLKENTADNQATFLTLLVNTVVIGNYTMPNVGVSVAGILAKGTYKGNDVNLLPYFNGELASSNRGGDAGVSINFLDDGGAEPLMKNKPSNTETSQQYFLLTHLYQFFGSLLGCSMQGMAGFDAYTADPSMYDVHKFMALNTTEVGYFIEQVGLAAASFGVADTDVTAVGTALNTLFGYRCAPPATAVKAQGPQLQSICITEDCPIAPMAVCDKYEAVVKPTLVSMSMSASASATTTCSSSSSRMATATGTAGMPMGTSSMTVGGSSTTMIPTAGAAANGLSLAAVAGGIAAFML